MDYLSIVELKKEDALQSWEIFSATGDPFDALEMVRDLRTYDLLLEGEDYLSLE